MKPTIVVILTQEQAKCLKNLLLNDLRCSISAVTRECVTVICGDIIRRLQELEEKEESNNV